MRRHLIHLVCGSTGAGKTTYATQLAERSGAVRFSIDEWMSALFWIDSPEPLDPLWSMERVERCLVQIWATARRVAELGVPCVLDIGLTRADSRARFVSLAREAGLSVRVHFVDAPREERWRRVQARNGEMRERRQLPFDVTREMFDFVESMWEPPTDAEMRAFDVLRIAATQGAQTSH
jgi:predicted kinase